MTFSATVLGNPPTKKTSNQLIKTTRGRTLILPNKKYRAWVGNARMQVRVQWIKATGRGAPTKATVNIAAVFYRKTHQAVDLSNLIEALGDMLQGEVIVNDRQVSGWDGSRLAFDNVRPRIELVLTEIAMKPTIVDDLQRVREASKPPSIWELAKLIERQAEAIDDLEVLVLARKLRCEVEVYLERKK